MQSIAPVLWFDDQAEQAAAFYVDIFPNSSIHGVVRYPDGSPAPAGTVMTVDFTLDGTRFTALNGGPQFRFTEAISFVVRAETQDDIDRLWDALTDGGEPSRCGWLTDRYGLSWQIVPPALIEMLGDPDPARASRVNQAMLSMGKLDHAALRAAYDG